jgi:hypothetical protein
MVAQALVPLQLLFTLPLARGSSSSGAPPPGCVGAFERLCGHASNCGVCTGQHQAALRGKGCGPRDVRALCSGDEPSACTFRGSLNHSVPHSCPGAMHRQHDAESSEAACRSWCCAHDPDDGPVCNAYIWHVGSEQCWVTSTAVDPAQCTERNHGDQWAGETRHPGPPPPPPPPPTHRWNLEPGLVPPKGMWRGATVDHRFAPDQDDNNTRAFEAAYDTRLHIFRTFKTPTWTEITAGEADFVASGGILFYSIQPQNWSEWVDWNAAWKINKFAAAIKKMAPHKVMIAPGFEPDGHAAESQNRSNLVYGTGKEYQLMYRNFRRQFAKQNVTNAVFVLDLSSNARNTPFVFPELYPGDEYVDWIFFNLFQSHKQSKARGNCTTILTTQYKMLELQLSAGVIKDAEKPWGVGAWGTMNSTFGAPPKYPSQPIPTADRQLCLQQMTDAFSDRQTFGRLKASIYFDSLNSLISPNPDTPYPSAELAPTLRNLLHLPVFTANDDHATP